MYKGLCCIVQGADHIAQNIICQDNAGGRYYERYGAAVVADGHGGTKYIRSDIGSRFAVESALNTIDAFMADYDAFTRAIRANSSYILTKIGEQFFARWTDKIEAYHREHPLTPEETEKISDDQSMSLYTFYGSTILAAVMAEDYYYGFLVGDGGFVVVNEEACVSIPIEDQNSYANYVSSICSRNAFDAFASFYREGTPLCLAVSTDGLIKSFGSEEDFKNYHVLLSASLQDLDKCRESIEKNFRKRTSQGSGDDISISLVTDPRRLKAGMDRINEKVSEQLEKKKNREQEEERARLKAQKEEDMRRMRSLEGNVVQLQRRQEELKRQIQELLEQMPRM